MQMGGDPTFQVLGARKARVEGKFNVVEGLGRGMNPIVGDDWN